MRETKTKYVGPSILGLLGILFVGLKLTAYIDWSWWLVLLPFYGPWVFAIILAIFLVATGIVK